MKERWYDRSGEEVLSILRTDAEKGLGKKEAANRLKTDGKNIVNPVQKAPIRGYLLQVLFDLSAVLMLAVAVLALVFRRDMGALCMLVILAVNYLVTLVSYIRAQRALEDLGYRAQPTAKVIRSGKLTVVAAESVVMGDILMLSHGDIVPCDARLLEAEELRVLEGNLFDADKAALKDASFQKAGALKPEAAVNMVYASTVVTAGRGKAVAVATGSETLVCRSGKSEPIAACHKLDIIGELKKFSSTLGVLILLPVFILTLAELLGGARIIETFLLSLAFAVAAMPEMYAAFAYVIVAAGMRWALGKKKSEGVFIKNPPALPALGNLNCLLLPLDSFYNKEESRLAAIYNCDKSTRTDGEKPGASFLRVLRYGIISTGLYGGKRLIENNHRGENVYTDEQEILIAAGEKFDLYNRELEDRYPILDHRDVGQGGSLYETTLVRMSGEDVVVLRGDPDEVLRCCTGYCRDGKIFEMDAFARNEFMGVASTMIKNGQKPIAIATKVSNYNNLMRIVDCQTNLVFEGFLSIEMPLLKGAAKQVLRLRDAGVRVLLFTEDENEVNRYLAAALGVAKEENKRVRSSELPSMEEGIFRINLKNYSLFEGFNASQLEYTVSILREDYGCRIGILTSDLGGVYPMYSADVGFSEEEGKLLGRVSEKEAELRTPLWQMGDKSGKSGCQALSHVSDVILPPSTSSGSGGINAIARAIGAARFIYRNIGLLLFYLISVCGMRFTALLFGREGQYLTPVQMLVSGLIFDLLAVFVIAFERPDGEFVPFRARKGKLLPFLGEVLPALGLGMCTSGAVILFASVLVRKGILAGGSVGSFCFISLMLCQAVLLMLLLRSGRRVLRNVHITPAQLLWLSALAAFFAVCFLFKRVGGLFDVSFIGYKGLLLACALPLVLFAAGIAARVIFSQNREKKKSKK